MKRKIDFTKIIKIAIGSMLSIIIADLLHLSSSSSAGIITLLSIQNTKKDTLHIGWKRYLSFLIALFISFIAFNLIGYNVIAFGVYLFLFVLISGILDLEDGISISSVLVTHFLIEQSMNIQLVVNELCILTIGIVIGILVNLYMPDHLEKIKRNQYLIEEQIKEILHSIVLRLHFTSQETNFETQLATLKEYIVTSLETAIRNNDNYLLKDASYYIRFLEMREQQQRILKQICTNLDKLTNVPLQGHTLAVFITRISASFHECNNGVELLDQLNRLKSHFRQSNLPTSREEFEDRALLLFILYDLENFLNIKKDFVFQLTKEEKERYWDSCK